MYHITFKIHVFFIDDTKIEDTSSEIPRVLFELKFNLEDNVIRFTPFDDHYRQLS